MNNNNNINFNTAIAIDNCIDHYRHSWIGGKNQILTDVFDCKWGFSRLRLLDIEHNW